MQIFAIGINHKTAPISVREKFFLTSTEQDLLLSELKSNPSILEAFVLCTCNRTEIYLSVLENYNPYCYIIKLLGKIKKIESPSQWKESFYIYFNHQAVEHLLRVATGLDSLVLGEKQVLGQMKTSFEKAQNHQMFSKLFNILSNIAIRSGKKAHSETEISIGGSSVSWAAITLAEKIIQDFSQSKILIIGAGKMSELAIKQLHSKGFEKLYLMNRTESNAQSLASAYGGHAVGFYDMKEVLTEVDICICSVGAPHYMIEKSTIEKILPKRDKQDLLLIDISMPRNIDPEIQNLPGIHLYGIDDLNEVVDYNMKIRQTAVKEVEDIIVKKIENFYSKVTKITNVQKSFPQGISS